MFEFSVDGKQVKAEVTFYTAYLYEAEFKSDLIKDLFGTQDFEPEIEVSDEKLVKVNFTKTNWNAVGKALWAAVKTADDSTPGYAAWMKRTKGLNMWLVGMLLSDEVADCFFRAEAAGEGEE